MFGLRRRRIHAIGVDMTRQGIRIAQLAEQGNIPGLLAGTWTARPEQIQPNTEDWYRWATQAIRQSLSSGPFKGKAAVGTLRPDQVVVETMRIQASDDPKADEAVLARLRGPSGQRWTAQDALVRFLQIDQQVSLVMAAERRLIDATLAIMEGAGLDPMAIIPWPQALAACYARFFGRRQSDLQAVVILVYFEPTQTEVVICRHGMPLFARCMPIGTDNLAEPAAIDSLVSEITACKRDLANLLATDHPTRVIFFTAQPEHRDACIAIAKQLQLQAQLADCLAAIQIPTGLGPQLQRNGLDRRACPDGWAMAFGLSLSLAN
ncbi:MAG: hypothetical protein QHH07_03925 [Sedimentisphaerales bacterium]|jgi:Tfp pilus assembly PilM family ATPase|nr:hypothetical protein [Sedimentisphaerales bacterium]